MSLCARRTGADGAPRHQRRVIMKISARNVLKGKILDITKGATTSHVRLDLGGGAMVTASITNEAVDELKLEVGQDAAAIIKASDVMIAVQ
jgi:molybdopterin-binding protein